MFRQDPNIWDLTTFLADEGVELIPFGTLSSFDKDNDLNLQGNQLSPSEKTCALRFSKPIKDYQFIEVDVYAIGGNTQLDIIAINDYAAYDPVVGTYSRAQVNATIGHVKTYRLANVGEIEAFIFDNIPTIGTFVIKDIRFYALPPTIRRLVPVDPNSVLFELGIRYEDLFGSYEQQNLLTYNDYNVSFNEEKSRWEFTLYNYPQKAAGLATFLFATPSVQMGLIRCSVPQEGRVGIGWNEIEDQLVLPFVKSSSQVSENLVTSQKPIVPVRAFYLGDVGVGQTGMTFWFELFNLEIFSDTNVFQTRSPTTVFGGAFPETNLKGVKGDKGDKGDKGEKGDKGNDGTDGTNGINGTDGADGADGTNGTDGVGGSNAIFYLDQDIDYTTDQWNAGDLVVVRGDPQNNGPTTIEFVDSSPNFFTVWNEYENSIPLTNSLSGGAAIYDQTGVLVTTMDGNCAYQFLRAGLDSPGIFVEGTTWLPNDYVCWKTVDGVPADGGSFTPLANNNTAYGQDTLPGTPAGVYTHIEDCTAVGFEALKVAATSSSGACFKNSAFGSEALSVLDIGSDNTAVGYAALSALVTGNRNVAVGSDALLSSNGQDDNTAIGASALRLNVSGSQNTAVGRGAMRLGTTGNFNTAIGYGALINTEGDENIGIGENSGYSNTTGNQNLFLGNGTNASAGNLSNCFAIGYGAVINASNKGVIGNASITDIYLGSTAALASLSCANITITAGNKLTLGNAAVTGLAAGVDAALTNATIVITDQAGQDYRIPCII